MKSPSSAIMVLLLLTHSTLGESQTCNSSMIKNAPDSRYIMATNGTVFDKKTGLIWMRCALGQTWNTSTCFGTPKTYTWQNALKAAESVSFAGQSDWRLPNQKELQSLVENSCYLPAINLKAFPNATNNTLWSATPRSANLLASGDKAWGIRFEYGGFSVETYKNSNFAIRLVRGGG